MHEEEKAEIEHPLLAKSVLLNLFSLIDEIYSGISWLVAVIKIESIQILTKKCTGGVVTAVTTKQSSNIGIFVTSIFHSRRRQKHKFYLKNGCVALI